MSEVEFVYRRTVYNKLLENTLKELDTNRLEMTEDKYIYLSNKVNYYNNVINNLDYKLHKSRICICSFNVKIKKMLMQIYEYICSNNIDKDELNKESKKDR
jgi:hypothetical protein